MPKGIIIKKGVKMIEIIKRRCQCGYCGKDSTSGIWFIPKNSRQKYANKNHYLRHQYNGKMPFKKICECGCSCVFYTIDITRDHVVGHRKKYRCSVCQAVLERGLDVIRTKKMNKNKFYFCINCWNQIML